nr:hypothetical protein [Tanacetum cinerariifolium]
MENPNHPNDLNVPEGEQAPAAPDGFAPQWIGEHDSNNNNGWIEWDVPLGGEPDEPEVNEEMMMMDDDDWDDDAEWLMALVTPPRATMTVSRAYEVGGPSTAAVEGPSSPLPAPGLPVPPTVIEDLSTRLVLMRKMKDVSDAEVAGGTAIGEIHPRVATMGEQVESRVDTHPSGQMVVQGQHVIVGSSQQIEWDVPLGGEVNEPMVDPEVNEEVVDDDDWDDEVEWLMAPVMPPRDTMTVSSTYERCKRCLRWVEAVMASLEERKDWKLQSNGDICLHHGGRRTK